MKNDLQPKVHVTTVRIEPKKLFYPGNKQQVQEENSLTSCSNSSKTLKNEKEEIYRYSSSRINNEICATCGKKIDNSRKIDNDDLTINVSIPLKRQPLLDEKNVETSVAFTLKRPNNRDESVEETVGVQPTLIVTEDCRCESALIFENKIQSKEEIVNDVDKDQEEEEEEEEEEDSGIISDLSRIISEADTDSESCQNNALLVKGENKVFKKFDDKKKRIVKAYNNRTQTHSRLFDLVTSDRLKVPKNVRSTKSLCAEKNRNVNNIIDNNKKFSLNSEPSLLTDGEINEKKSYYPRSLLLPVRPKSLDFEALLLKNNDHVDNLHLRDNNNKFIDPYWTRLRVNVNCPRVKSTRNVPNSRFNYLYQRHCILE